MIIFDLDCLADDSHRRHFIDPSCHKNYTYYLYGALHPSGKKGDWHNKETQEVDFKPDFASYEAAGGDDKPIWPLGNLLEIFDRDGIGIQIWSSISESLKQKTIDWFEKIYNFSMEKYFIQMRPDGDETPKEVLFEKWINERCSDLMTALIHKKNAINHDIEMVFSSHKPTIQMFRSRGAFVFDCNQGY